MPRRGDQSREGAKGCLGGVPSWNNEMKGRKEDTPPKPFLTGGGHQEE